MLYSTLVNTLNLGYTAMQKSINENSHFCNYLRAANDNNPRICDNINVI